MDTQTQPTHSDTVETDVHDQKTMVGPPMIHVEDATVEHHTEVHLLNNHFSVFSAIGVNYSLIGTPIAIGAYLSFSIGVGGSPVYVFGYIITIIFQLFVCASLAELASLLPHAAGQVYWTTVLAPRRVQRPLSYACGVFTSAAWFLWSCGTFLLVAQVLCAVVKMCQPAFSPHLYQLYLVLCAAAVFAVTINTVFFKYYPWILRFVVGLINAATIIVLVTLLVRTSPKRSARTVFLDFANETGWNSDGLVFFLGLLPALSSLNGFDSSAHLAAEMSKPSVQIPQVMLGTAVMGALSGLPMTMVYMFCVTNEENLLAPVGGQPFAQLLLDSLNLFSVALLITIILNILLLIGGASMVTTFSRVLWTFAEDSPFPCSKWAARVNTAWDLPLNAIIFATIMPCLLGLLVLGPTFVINAVVGAGIVCFFCSYSIAISCLIPKRREICTRRPYFSLGWAGPVVNIIAVSWMVLMSVMLCLPLYRPVTAANMNYTIAVVGVLAALSLLNWKAYAQRHYTPYAGPMGR